MFCKNCGTRNDGQSFCTNCGAKLDNLNIDNSKYNEINKEESSQNTKSPNGLEMDTQQAIKESSQTTNQINNNYINKPTNSDIKTNQINNSYIDKAVNPDMNKWAVLSIVIPSIAIFIYMFIGLSFILAIIIAGVGFDFAKKGEMANKQLAKIGKILNGILVGIAIIMLIWQLVTI